jgi:broad specificity phosphatase PhoE
MITIIFIRHGEKAFDNGRGPVGSYQHDPPLKSGSEVDVKVRGVEIIGVYGKPAFIIASPYRRTRDTALLLRSSLDSKHPDIRLDVNISEFLGWQKPRYGTPLAEPDTLAHKVPLIGETMAQLRNRCKEHLKLYDLNTMPSDGKSVVSGKSTVVWVVTHGIVISTLYTALQNSAKLYGLTVEPKPWERSPPELSGFVLKGQYGSGGTVKEL